MSTEDLEQLDRMAEEKIRILKESGASLVSVPDRVAEVGLQRRAGESSAKMESLLEGQRIADQRLQHQVQIGKRERKLDVMMSGLVSVGIMFGTRDIRAPADGLLDIGTSTILVMRQNRGARRGPPVIRLAGYEAFVEDGTIGIGYHRGNVCAYDFRACPMAKPSRSSQVVAAHKTSMVEMGLRLDSAIMATVADPTCIRSFVELPLFWCGFRPGEVPEVEDCPAARKAALALVRDGWTLPSMMALGGEVTHVGKAEASQREKAETLICWGGTRENPEALQSLPPCAVLRPFVKEGSMIESGTALGDYMPRRLYPHWGSVVKAVGEEIAGCLLAETVLTSDERHRGLICRKVEYCAGSIGRAAQVFEDVRHLLNENKEGVLQVISRRNVDALVHDQLDDKLRVDLLFVRPDWARKLG